jgi:hypothetical protein
MESGPHPPRIEAHQPNPRTEGRLGSVNVPTDTGSQNRHRNAFGGLSFPLPVASQGRSSCGDTLQVLERREEGGGAVELVELAGYDPGVRSEILNGEWDASGVDELGLVWRKR